MNGPRAVARRQRQIERGILWTSEQEVLHRLRRVCKQLFFWPRRPGKTSLTAAIAGDRQLESWLRRMGPGVYWAGLDAARTGDQMTVALLRKPTAVGMSWPSPIEIIDVFEVSRHGSQPCGSPPGNLPAARLPR